LTYFFLQYIQLGLSGANKNRLHKYTNEINRALFFATVGEGFQKEIK